MNSIHLRPVGPEREAGWRRESRGRKSWREGGKEVGGGGERGKVTDGKGRQSMYARWL